MCTAIFIGVFPIMTQKPYRIIILLSSTGTSPADALAKENERLRMALARQLDAHRATWMAARAEVEGAETANALFEKEPEVIEARAILAQPT